MTHTWFLLTCSSALSLIIGYFLDNRFGDPVHHHPIITYGRWIAWGEARLNRGKKRQLKGTLYHALLILTVGFVGVLLLACPIAIGLWADSDWLTFIGLVLVQSLGIFFMISGRTLRREVEEVFTALERSLSAGRKQVSRIVGRDTAHLSELEVQTAALETLSENLSDGVVAPLFWFGLLGLPGILMYKMINTLDSMVGYKTERYLAYGRSAAQWDDCANFLPARLTAALMLIVVWRPQLWTFVRQYGPAHTSPNSGYPEAALAGILNCRFGGTHSYSGTAVTKPYIGHHQRQFSRADLHLAILINRRVECIAVGSLALMLTICSLLLWVS